MIIFASCHYFNVTLLTKVPVRRRVEQGIAGEGGNGGAQLGLALDPERGEVEVVDVVVGEGRREEVGDVGLQLLHLPTEPALPTPMWQQ